MLKVQTFALVLCALSLAGLAMYTIEILNPGTEIVQQAEAIRRNTHQCATPIAGSCL